MEREPRFQIFNDVEYIESINRVGDREYKLKGGQFANLKQDLQWYRQVMRLKATHAISLPKHDHRPFWNGREDF